MRKHSTCLIIFLVVASALLPAQTKVNGDAAACNVHLLPQFIQNYLQQQSNEWRVLQSKDLGSRAHGRWDAEKPLACPGIAYGKFNGTGELSYAVLLVPTNEKVKGYRLLGFNFQSSTRLYQKIIIDQSDKEDATRFFIHSIGIGGFFDPQFQKKFQARTQEGILFIDASEQEYEADVYIWGAGKYHRQPIDY